MAAPSEWVVPLDEAAAQPERVLGGKAAKLAALAEAGFRVPPGFCIPTPAYEVFVAEARLGQAIRMELGRKPFESMRWEEIWDAALRIRSTFLAASIPPPVAQAIAAAVRALGRGKALAVRSSAPGEDSAQRSFAGLHESVVGVRGEEAVLDAVRVVWASLWSDAALLYRQELALDPAESRMAVVVQEVVEENRSGVAFGRDPRQPALDQAIVECVPGPCGDLVDGIVDPDRWILHRDTGQVLSWRPGEREDEAASGPILEGRDLDRLLEMLLRVESTFGWAADTEWT
ncbi:MAG: PEP/pyruvate-binding domain-containing protein, partial [Anaerolineae bacterium]